MINQETGFAPTDREWTGRPTDMRQIALEVIATTRYAWVSRDAADDPVAGRARFADPLFGLALDAKSSSAGRARAIRARSGRRAPLRFAT